MAAARFLYAGWEIAQALDAFSRRMNSPLGDAADLCGRKREPFVEKEAIHAN